MPRVPLSILDLAIVGAARPRATASRRASRSPSAPRRSATGGSGTPSTTTCAAIASSATSVLIAHVAAHTTTIRLGAGGIMLPNHSPLVIAEQFGTLADAASRPHRPRPRPRAGHATRHTMRALRRDPPAADRFPQDVLELQGYLAGESRVPGVDADPRARARTCRSTSSARRCSARSSPPRSACRTPSPRTSRRSALERRGRRSTAATSARRRSSTRPYVIAGVNVDRRRHRRRGAASSCSTRDRRRVAALLRPRPRRSPTTRPTRSSLAAGPRSSRPDDALHRRRHARRGRATTSTTSPSTPTPTS